MDFIKNLFSSFLGEPHSVNYDTGQMTFDCPACLEMGKGKGKHKLSINYKLNVFRCWVCAFENNMHGKIPFLIKRYGNKDILKEYELLIENIGDNKDVIKPIINEKIELPKDFVKLTKENENVLDFNKAYSYIKNRGITDEQVIKYNIGYVPIGKYRGRIIIPSHDIYGDVNYFVARSYDYKIKPKYLAPSFSKEELIFNEYFINFNSTIYLVEGVFDSIAVPNSIPLLGKFLYPKIKKYLYEKAMANIVIVLDYDAYEHAIKIFKELNVGRLYGKIYICPPIKSSDVADVYAKLGNEGVIKYLKRSYKPKELDFI